RVSGAPSSLAELKIYYRDDGEPVKYYLANNALFALDFEPQDIFLKLKSYKKLRDIIVEINKKEGATFILHAAELNVSPPYDFSKLRFLLILFAALFIIVSSSYKWSAVFTDTNDRNYKIAAAAVLITAVICSFAVYKALDNPDKFTNIYYPFNPEAMTRDPYLLVFDAFQKGQAHLDIAPDPKLLALENQYSQGARNQAGAVDLHDYAFYKNKYYVYFGVAPVVFIYYPYYWITGSLPPENVTTFIMSLACIFFIFGAFSQLVKTFCKKVNLMLFSFVYLAIAFGSLLFMLQANAYRYEIAHLGGYIFFAASIMFAFKAYNKIEPFGLKSFGERIKVMILLAFAGTSFACIGITRPNVYLTAFAFLLPVAIKILLNKNLSGKFKIQNAVSFLLPCLAVFCMIFYYNRARFESIFEFGAIYNLSGIVIREFDFTMLFNLPRAIFYYFFDMPDFTPVFPYLNGAIHAYNNSGAAFYGDRNAGIMLIPLIWALLLWWKANPKYSKNDSLIKATAVSAFAGVCANLIVLYGLAGALLRYTCDVRLCLLFISGLFMLNTYNNIKQAYAKRLFYKIFIAMCFISIFAGFCLIFGGTYKMWDLIRELSPKAYAALFNLFV
ncbi:MAG: hypothetical protein LBQ47_04675, partial [Endomicrobium sp.]|nr:hypothetical protein [Endomicrobium sp.]